MLHIQRATERKDLERIEFLAGEGGFQLTLQCRELSTRIANSFNYLVLNENDEAVGFRVVILFAPDRLYKFQAYLIEDYQNKKLFHKVERMIEADLRNFGWDGKSYVCDANHTALNVFRWASDMMVGPSIRLIRGEVNADKLQSFPFPQLKTEIRKVTTPADLILASTYDKDIHPTERKEFLEAMCGFKIKELGPGWIAVEGGVCIGFVGLGNVTPGKGMFATILYADHPSVALVLMKTAMEHQLGRQIMVYLHLKKAELLRLLVHLNWDIGGDTYFRVNTGRPSTIPWHKVYGLSEYCLV